MLPAAPPFTHPTYPTPAEPHPPSPVPVVAGYLMAPTRWSSASSSQGQGTDTTSTSTIRRWMAVDDGVTTTSDLVGFPPSRSSFTATGWHGESAPQPTGVGSEVVPEASSTRRSDLMRPKGSNQARAAWDVCRCMEEEVYRHNPVEIAPVHAIQPQRQPRPPAAIVTNTLPEQGYSSHVPTEPAVSTRFDYQATPYITKSTTTTKMEGGRATWRWRPFMCSGCYVSYSYFFSMS
ncbi:uncharacterized protein LOC120659124 [Panicum virgatum]|uniref:Uncharacterized protein n=1 Tax=Panicum virgatum TaxID=38727 RepID=A0A8T0VC56_PANVG|nr:uncharacterized protein LOC120659124 [Panicum virgatum]KAG2632800.1 hypothetical protein PVAP13_2NG128906 [Panicum virgatum]